MNRRGFLSFLGLAVVAPKAMLETLANQHSLSNIRVLVSPTVFVPRKIVYKWDLSELSKALEAGRYDATPLGSPLQIESLEPTMKVVTFSKERIKLRKEKV